MVLAARERQAKRNYSAKKDKTKSQPTIKLNSELSPRELEEFIVLDPTVRATLEKAGTRLALSPRAFHRVIKVAQTIADLEGSEAIQSHNIAEAVGFRSLDRGVWSG